MSPPITVYVSTPSWQNIHKSYSLLHIWYNSTPNKAGRTFGNRINLPPPGHSPGGHTEQWSKIVFNFSEN